MSQFLPKLKLWGFLGSTSVKNVILIDEDIFSGLRPAWALAIQGEDDGLPLEEALSLIGDPGLAGEIDSLL